MQHKYITQEEAVDFFLNHTAPGIYHEIDPGEAAVVLNAAIQQYIDSQPKPGSVGLIEVPAAEANDYSRILTVLGMEEEGDPVQAITQQAEALAQALAEVERLKGIESNEYTETMALRAQLAALQYDGELPEPTIMAQNVFGFSIYGYTADQVRQAIANDRAKRVPQCVCGENTLGVVHRNDGPCYWPTDPHIAIAAFAAAPDPKGAV